MEVSPYLFFDGDAEAALKFYCDVFGGEIEGLSRVGDSPMAAQTPKEQHSRVMHATFKAPGVTFMASDGSIDSKYSNERISLSIGTSDVPQGERIFKKLSEGGKVSMPLEDMFWGAKFGQVTDRFGIDWMINISKN